MTARSICGECGHWIPPEDPTDEQVDAFLEDDSTTGCGECSALWLVLLTREAARAAEDVTKRGSAE